MKFILFFLIYFSSINTALAGGGGQDIGSGGDLVLCNGPKYEGWYALDYLVHHKPKDDKLKSVQNIESSLDRIENNLKSKLPELLNSFLDFRRQLYSNEFTNSRLWEDTPYQLINILDENLGVSDQIPDDCKVKGFTQFSQAVIRMNPEFSGTGPGITLYKYMKSLMEQVAVKRPLQISFLLIHEWLWDHSTVVDRNRRLVSFFHSKDFLNWSREKILVRLSQYGFKLPTDKEGAKLYFQHSCLKSKDFLKKYSEKFTKKNSLDSPIDIYPLKALQRTRKCSKGLCEPWRTLETSSLLRGKNELSVEKIDGKTIKISGFNKQGRYNGDKYYYYSKIFTLETNDPEGFFIKKFKNGFLSGTTISGFISAQCIWAQGFTKSFEHEIHTVIYSDFLNNS